MSRTRFKGGGKRGQSYEEFFGYKRRGKSPLSKIFGRKRGRKGCAGMMLLLLAGFAGFVLLAIRVTGI